MFASVEDDNKALKAAAEIKKYCIQTGCLYCNFMKQIGDDMICRIGRPREWEVYKEKVTEEDEKDEYYPAYGD